MAQDRATGWGDGLGGRLQDAREAITEVGKEAQQAVVDVGLAVGPLRNSLEHTITAHPVKAILVALTAGVILGWLIKRS
jgi:hypothetical protein